MIARLKPDSEPIPTRAALALRDAPPAEETPAAAGNRSTTGNGTGLAAATRIEVTELWPGSTSGLSAELQSTWQELFRLDPEAHLDQHPDYAPLSLNRHPPERAIPGLFLLFRDQASPAETPAAAILLPKSIRVAGAGRFLQSHWTGYRFAGNRCLGPITPARMQALVQAAAAESRARGADFLLAEDLDDPSPLRSAFEQLAAQRWHPFSPTGVQPRLRIRIPAEPNDYWNQFSSKTKYNFRRAARKLEATLETHRTADQIPLFLQRAHEISLRTWQSRALGLRVQNSAYEANVFELACRLNAFRSYTLMRHGQPIAFIIGRQYSGCFWLEEIGYDPAFSEFSPGTTLLVQALTDLLTHNPPQWFDFGGGDAAYKQLLANEHGLSGNLILLAPGLRRTASLQLTSLTRQARRWSRELLSQTGLIGRARHFFRSHLIGHVPRFDATGTETSVATEGGVTADSAGTAQSVSARPVSPQAVTAPTSLLGPATSVTEPTSAGEGSA